MADIAFILLIFFLLTSAMDIEKEVKVNLPETRMRMSESKKYFMLWVDRDGSVIIKGKKADREELYRAAKYRSLDNADVKALLGADKNLPFRTVYSVMESLQEAGVHNIVLVSRKKPSSEK